MRVVLGIRKALEACPMCLALAPATAFVHDPALVLAIAIVIVIVLVFVIALRLFLLLLLLLQASLPLLLHL